LNRGKNWFRISERKWCYFIIKFEIKIK
jgi:hypothetical protein